MYREQAGVVAVVVVVVVCFVVGGTYASRSRGGGGGGGDGRAAVAPQSHENHRAGACLCVSRLKVPNVMIVLQGGAGTFKQIEEACYHLIVCTDLIVCTAPRLIWHHVPPSTCVLYL